MGRTDLDSGKFYAKVLLKEPLPLMMQESIAVFARGTGASGPVMWPDKENRMGKRAAGQPPEAYIAYPTESDRQAALDENQQRPGEWGFYAAAARGGKDEKGRKSRVEGEATREPFTELQPPNMERSGLLGDVPTEPAAWAYKAEMAENWHPEAGWNAEPWSAQDFQWPEFRDREPEIDFPIFVDSPERTSNETWPSAALVSSIPTLPAAEELVRPFDSTTGSALDLEEAEYRKMVLCLPECLMDTGEDPVDEYKDVNATPVRGQQRLSSAPSTPECNSAAAVALWRPIHNGLPFQNTFIHFQDRLQAMETCGSSLRSKSCPAVWEEAENRRAAFARAQTFDYTPCTAKLPTATELPDFGSPERGTTRQRAVALREKNARHALETPVRREAGQPEDEHTPAPKTNPRHMRRGTRGRGSTKEKSKIWRPTLWKENSEQY